MFKNDRISLKDGVISLLKQNRKNIILSELDKNNFVKVTDLQKKLNVTEMTVRRDLKELESEGGVVRIHGGAKKRRSMAYIDMQHDERNKINVEEKRIIAQKAASLLKEGDVIFISASTTNELLHQYITVPNIKVITNCLYIYYQYMTDPNFEVILIGGKYNMHLQSFLGAITLETLSKINFTKAFVGTNGISNNDLSASNDEEGLLHKTILDNSMERYVLCDSSKFNSDSFFNFYTCDKLTAIIVDNNEIKNIKEYRNIVNII